MNLKEAFRFQNRIQGLMNEAQNILSRDQNVTETKNTYLRSKVMEGAEDAVLVDIPNTDYADRITAVVDFLVYLLGQKEALAAAIHKAKAAQEIDQPELLPPERGFHPQAHGGYPLFRARAGQQRLRLQIQ